jgi:hypothetical protein
MRFLLILIGLVFLAPGVIADNNDSESSAPPKATITGKVTDKLSNEELVGVIIDVEGTDISVFTDINGEYKLKNLKSGKYTLNIKYISYKETVVENINIEASSTENVNIQLSPL